MELSHPLLRAPFEQVNRSFRLYHKQLTKELAGVTAGLAELHDTAQPLDADAAVQRLDALSARVERLQRDARQLAAEQQRELESCQRRAQYASELATAAPLLEPSVRSSSFDPAAADAAQRALRHRLAADYLLSRGLLASGGALAAAHGLAPVVDEALHAERERVAGELAARRTGAALAWCARNASRLRRLRSRLEFRLRLQDVLELVRAARALDAVEYARAFVTPLALARDDDAARRADLAELEAAMGSLAFAPPGAAPLPPPYAALFAPERWTQLAAAFRREFHDAYALPEPPALCVALFAGLSALNTRTCAREREARAKLARPRTEGDGDATKEQDDCEDAEPQSKKTKRSDEREGVVASGAVEGADAPVCPACSEAGAALCAGLPLAYHPHSRLVCRVTRKVMDEHNPPRVLPNGRVYSQEGIEQLQRLNERSGMIRCVETQELFAVSDVKPVYIL